MNRVIKIVFWISIVFLGLWIVTPIIRMALDLEFASDSIKSEYKKFLFFAVPIAILLTLFGTLKSKDNTAKTIGKVTGTIAIGFGTIFIMFMSIFTDMCVWTDRHVLYENKKDSNTKIIVRDFGCRATDSELPRVGVYKVHYVTNYFIRSTEIDTAKIDKNKWIKIK